MKRTVLKERHYKAGYVIKTELVDDSDYGGDGRLEMKAAYTPGGDYIGNSRLAHLLCKKRGIRPEKRSPDSGVCSIGFCEVEQKWYGWSHRAIFGFGVGDAVSEGDCCASSGLIDEYLAEHPEEDLSLPVGFTAETLDDAKQMAIAFAHSVS